MGIRAVKQDLRGIIRRISFFKHRALYSIGNRWIVQTASPKRVHRKGRKERHILQITYPPVDSFLHHAFPLSILSVHDDYLPWFYSNYIQLHYSNTYPKDAYRSLNFFRYPGFEVSFSPWLNIERISEETWSKSHGDLIEFVICCIDSGRYIKLYVDEFYIPDRVPYRKLHHVHEILIVGYDTRRETVEIAGYNQNSQYGTTSIDYTDLERGFGSCRSKYLYVYEYHTKGSYRFDPYIILEQIEDYLLSKNTSERFSMISQSQDDVYGMNIYPYLRDYLNGVSSADNHLLVLPLHILWEHKKCMRLRIKYLEDLGFLDPSREFYGRYEDIEKRTNTLRSTMLRFQITGNEKLIHKMTDVLASIADEEQVVLQDMVGELRKTATEFRQSRYTETLQALSTD